MGALAGVVLMVLFRDLPGHVSHTVFYVAHPIHVVLSALVTASMYEMHNGGRMKLWMLIAVGYVGAIGVATVSDSVIPYIGEILLDMPHRHAHIGFIEKWWLINPLAFLGIAIAYFRPSTKFPHSGHVLLSTAASLFHVLMAIGADATFMTYLVVFFFLLLSVWIPCCVSDIVFPLLFVGPEGTRDSGHRHH